jgi:phosphoglycerate dehydrogenase-like enzyme
MNNNNMSQFKIAILDDYQNIALSSADWTDLKEKNDITVFNDHLFEEDQIVARLHPFDVISVMRERTPLTRSLLSKLPNLKLIISTGLRNASIDLDAVEEFGIELQHTGYVTSGAPELTWGLLMAIARNIPAENQNVKQGGWQTTVGVDLKGKTLALLGLGNIGQKLATIGKAFDMHVIAWSENLTEEKAAAFGVKYVSKETLFKEADFLTVLLVLSARSRHIVDMADLQLMKPTAYLVNTSRGPLVNEAALISVLENKQIGGAALDVFETEPLPADHAFRKLDNVLATPHIGFVTEHTYEVFFHDIVKILHDWTGRRR